MTLRKKRIRVIGVSLILSLLFTSVISAVSADTKKDDSIDLSSASYKEVITPDNDTFTAPLKSRRVDPSLDKINQLTSLKTKILGSIKQEYQQANESDLIKVRVSLKSGDDKKQFITELEKLTKQNTEYKKVEFDTYDMMLTKEQINQLEAMDEVEFLSSPDSYSYVDGEPTDNSSYITLNAATEMTGAKKGRTDYGVTGDLNGNATSYTTNDIVIAVLDTGIDASHVDLDGGKVIGWFDAVSGLTTPYDNNGHGTHVASIIAGTGEGDSAGTQVGFAPGAALVGVKVCNGQGTCSDVDIVQGLQWIFNNRNTLNIDAVNMSLGTLDSLVNVQDTIDLINDLNNAGVPVFVSAGNDGDGFCTKDANNDDICDSAQDVIYYNTLSTYAENTDFSVGSIKDPYESGWGLSVFSSRGTASIGPWIVSTGENIRAARANSTNQYVTLDGTSMAAPSAAGVYALMLDAYFTTGSTNGGTLTFTVEDFGVRGFDKNYGNGNLIAHDTIKRAAGSTTGSFNDFRDNLYATGTIAVNTWDFYDVNVYGTGAAFNTTLLVTSESGQDLDLYIWSPGTDPATDAPLASSTSNVRLPQEFIKVANPTVGVYKIGVRAYDTASYSLDFSGQIN